MFNILLLLIGPTFFRGLQVAVGLCVSYVFPTYDGNTPIVVNCVSNIYSTAIVLFNLELQIRYIPNMLFIF